ncbi:basic helix-loop-helix 38, OBP3-RESPONSIVE GENE 3 [Hibiscus trionum]|uniref:Basic helix-loop-helix 38, OBP3-RESPONSIVE GENE 3 n=1 Tax=Hibiscus trionum TaxID=183268 RepID=A0A9W7M9H2_HIBTR|nr:basic helix-loop-helix 38, OBP3-RESPONSIVE GENE 3 [Hibiscus trionum]
MCALTPFSTPNWPLVNSTGYGQNYFYESSGCLESLFPLEIPLDSQSPASFTQTSNLDVRMVKKLNHNASERDRRKKINSMYSSLRSLLPEADQTKKLSFPATVSHALKYIPELQEQVERLVRKKEELMLRVSEQGGGKRSDHEEQRRKSGPKGRCLSGSVAVSMNRVGDGEVSVQIARRKVDNRSQLSLSEMLHYLEQQGFLLLNASSFESFGGIVFYNIHLQMELETACKLGSEEALSEKILAL